MNAYEIVAKDPTWTPAHAVRPTLDIALVFVKDKDCATLDHCRLFPVRQPPCDSRDNSTLRGFEQDQGIVRIFTIPPEWRFDRSRFCKRVILCRLKGELRQRGAVRRYDGVPLHVDVLDTLLLGMGIRIRLYELMSSGLLGLGLGLSWAP